ncbi:hypothetical protein DLAC_03096 [Tieghemostelium lacteum]|uniref:Uncharacterized protein n=1 Tax=Tieghemostelium lacteum TaxID=361077 RepID=A0A152A2R2_TIELA|nr:hypothetical protein DLAC_03096 [Tieghemostelium lacteum]|eukprot:KYR00351.1 hypothetical protein DLAC_03096 [Tieghemostelium lacteum]
MLDDQTKEHKILKKRIKSNEKDKESNSKEKVKEIIDTDDSDTEEEEQTLNEPRKASTTFIVIRYLCILIVFFILQKLLTGKNPFDFVPSIEKQDQLKLENQIRSRCTDPQSESCTNNVNKIMNNLKKHGSI